MSARNSPPGVKYGAVGSDFKEQLDAEFEAGDDAEYRACHNTAPTCTSCCGSAIERC